MTARLTLTWANKDKALLSHGETGYEWVERDDPRAREVRRWMTSVALAPSRPADNSGWPRRAPPDAP